MKLLAEIEEERTRGGGVPLLQGNRVNASDATNIGNVNANVPLLTGFDSDLDVAWNVACHLTRNK